MPKTKDAPSQAATPTAGLLMPDEILDIAFGDTSDEEDFESRCRAHALPWLRLAVANMTSEYVPVTNGSTVRIGSVSVNGARIPIVWRGEQAVAGAWVPLIVAVTGCVGGFGRGQTSQWDDLSPGQVGRLWSWLLFGAGAKDRTHSGQPWDPRPNLTNWGSLLSGVPLEDLIDVPPVQQGKPGATSHLLMIHPHVARFQSQEPFVKATFLPVLLGLSAFDSLLLSRTLQIGFLSVDDRMVKRTWKADFERQRMPVRLGKPGYMMGLGVELIVCQSVCPRRDRARWVEHSLGDITPALRCVCAKMWSVVATALRGPNHKALLAAIPQCLQREDPGLLLASLTTVTLNLTAPGLIYNVADMGDFAVDVETNMTVVAMAAVIAVAVRKASSGTDQQTGAGVALGPARLKAAQWATLADYAEDLIADADAWLRRDKKEKAG